MYAPQVKAVNQQPLPSTRGINTTGSQVKALNGQQRPLAAPLPITLINSTAGLNSTAGQSYTFAATSPAATSDQVLYLGYHGTTNPTHGNSDSKHDESRDSKPSTHSSTKSVSYSSSKDKDTKPTIPHIKITVTDNDSKAK